MHKFTHVMIASYITAGVSIEVPEAREISFVDCSFAGNGTGKYGVTTALGGGAFYWRGGNMEGNTVADFYLGPPNDAIHILSGYSENGASLLQTRGNSGNAWAVTIEGFSWNSWPADGTVIRYTHRGPLTLIGNEFCTARVRDCQIAIDSTGPAAGVAMGNLIFGNYIQAR